MGAVRITVAVAATLTLAVTPVLAADLRDTARLNAPRQPMSTPPVPIPTLPPTDFPSPPPDPGPDRTLTLTGTGSGYVDVPISGTARFYEDQFVATKTGTYAGWVVQRVATGEVVFGGLRHNAWGAGTMHVAKSPAWRTGTVTGGTFRFYLVTDGTATVKIRVGGLGSDQTLAASNPATAAAGSVNLGDFPVVTSRTPVTSTGRSLVVAAVKHSSTAGAVVRVNACVRKTNTEECDPVTSSVAAVNVTSSISTTRVSWPGETAAGPWFAVHQVQAVAALPSAVGVWFTLDATI